MFCPECTTPILPENLVVHVKYCNQDYDDLIALMKQNEHFLDELQQEIDANIQYTITRNKL